MQPEPLPAVHLFPKSMHALVAAGGNGLPSAARERAMRHRAEVLPYRDRRRDRGLSLRRQFERNVSVARGVPTPSRCPSSLHGARIRAYHAPMQRLACVFALVVGSLAPVTAAQ